MKQRVKVLVLPIFRRYWLWHAWTDPAAEQAVQAAKALPDWRQGVGLEEKLQLLGTQLSQRVRGGAGRRRAVLCGTTRMAATGASKLATLCLLRLCCLLCGTTAPRAHNNGTAA